MAGASRGFPAIFISAMHRRFTAILGTIWIHLLSGEEYAVTAPDSLECSPDDVVVNVVAFDEAVYAVTLSPAVPSANRAEAGPSQPQQ